MKRPFPLIALLLVLASLGTYQAVKAEGTLASFRDSFELATYHLNEDYESERSCEDFTYLPDQGLRGLYCHTQHYLSYEKVQGLTSLPIFLKGPHHQSLDLTAQHAFGYYNPAFVAYFHQSILSPFLNHPAFVAKTRTTYDAHLKELLRSYYLAHQLAQSQHQWVANALDVEIDKAAPVYVDFQTAKAEYLKQINSKTLPEMYLTDLFRGLSYQLASSQMSEVNWEQWGNLNTAFGWWLRRSLDGTDQAFFKILESFLTTYDPVFLAAHRPSAP